MVENEASVETQFAIINQKLGTILDRFDELLEIQKNQGALMQDHEKRLTRLEAEAEEQQKFRDALSRVAWWAFGLLAAASVIAGLVLLGG